MPITIPAAAAVAPDGLAASASATTITQGSTYVFEYTPNGT
jgi:hypothetical protein